MLVGGEVRSWIYSRISSGTAGVSTKTLEKEFPIQLPSKLPRYAFNVTQYSIYLKPGQDSVPQALRL